MSSKRTTNNPSVLCEEDELQWKVQQEQQRRRRQQSNHNRGNLDQWPILQELTPGFVEKVRQFMVIGQNGDGVMVLTDDGLVYWYGTIRFGWNEFEELRQTDEPTRIDVPSVASMAHGDQHLLLLTDEGQCWAMGKNERGQLGLGTIDEDEIYFEPVLIETKHRFIGVRCGLDHSLALTDNHRVMAWGANDWGQVGLDTEKFQSHPTPHLVSPDSYRVVEIASGAEHSLALTDQGLVYAWGSNDCGQLGCGDNVDTICHIPTRINIPQPVKGLAAGDSHTLLLTQSGELLACGKNDCGQLGLASQPECSECSVPTRVEGLPVDCLIIEIGCHFNTHLSVALLFDRQCYVWGQLCSGRSISVPFRLPPIYSTLDSALALHSTHRSTPHSIPIEDPRPNRLVDRLTAMFDNPHSNSDIQFVVDQQSIHAHRFFLQITSQHLRQVLQESAENGNVISVNNSQGISENIPSIIITDYSYPVYHAYLRFLYTGQVVITSKTVLELFQLAHSYGEDQLEQHCLQWMRLTVSVENCCRYYQLAVQHQLLDFEQQLARFIECKSSLIAWTGDFQSMDPDLIQKLRLTIANMKASQAKQTNKRINEIKANQI